MLERLSKPGKNKYVVKGLMLILDVFLVCFALYSSFWLRFEGQIPQQYWDYKVSLLILVCLLSLESFSLFNMYNIRCSVLLTLMFVVAFRGDRSESFVER